MDWGCDPVMDFYCTCPGGSPTEARLFDFSPSKDQFTRCWLYGWQEMEMNLWQCRMLDSECCKWETWLPLWQLDSNWCFALFSNILVWRCISWAKLYLKISLTCLIVVWILAIQSFDSVSVSLCKENKGPVVAQNIDFTHTCPIIKVTF